MTSKPATTSALLALIPPPPPVEATAKSRSQNQQQQPVAAAPTNPRQWINNPSSARVALGDQTNSAAGTGSINAAANNKKYVTNLSPLPRVTGGEEQCDAQYCGASSSLDAGATTDAPLLQGGASGGDNVAKLQCRYTMNKYNFLKNFTVKPKTPGSIEKLKYLQEPAKRNVRQTLALMGGQQLPLPPPVAQSSDPSPVLPVPTQRNLVLSPLPVQPTVVGSSLLPSDAAADDSFCGEQVPEPPATVVDNITSTPPPTERNLFHYFADAGLTVVDVLCFDSPMTPPHQIRRTAAHGTDAESNESETVNPVFYLSPTPTALVHTGPRPRSRSAPSSFPIAHDDSSWSSVVAPAGDGASSMRSHSAPRGESLSLPSPWQRENTEEGSPFVLDDADDILVEEVSASSDDGYGSPADHHHAGATKSPIQSASEKLEAYSPSTIALIATDDEARHELTVYLDTAAGMMHTLFLQRCTALFSHGCLSLAMLGGIKLEEGHERYLIGITRDAFMRATIHLFLADLAEQEKKSRRVPAAAKTPPASQKSEGPAGRRRQYLASHVDPPVEKEAIASRDRDLTSLF